MNKNTKIVLSVIAIFFGFIIVSSIFGYFVTRDLTGYSIKNSASYYFGEDIEFYNNDGNIQINAVVTNGYLSVSDYTNLRNFLGRLRTKNDKGSIYSITISFQGIGVAAVVTKDIYNNDWMSISDTKELARLTSMTTF
jgi:hypothetical protein